MTLGITPLLSVVRTLVEAGGFCLLFLCLDRPKLSWKKTCLCYGAFVCSCVIVGTLWVLIDPDSFVKYVTMTIFLEAAVFFPLMSRDHFFQVLYNLSLQIFVLLFMIVAGILLAKRFFGGDPWADIAFRVLGMLLLAVVYLKWFRRLFRRIADYLRAQWWGISLISVAGNALVLYYATRPEEVTLRGVREQVIFFSICALTFLMHIVMLYMLYLMQREMADKQELELTALNNQLLKRELTLMREQMEDTRRIRHDLRHHDRMIAEYVRKGETEALLECLEQRESEYAAQDSPRICENITVNNILEAYAGEARQKGICVTLQVSVGQETGIRENDFIAIFGNAMENAIHGCESSGREDKRISVYCRQRDGKLAVRIANTCGERVRFENGLPVRSGGGGIGVTSILRSVEKYKGEVDFEAEEGEFVARILLKLPETCRK